MVDNLNETLAQSVADNIEYRFLRDVLVKPMPPIMITREFEVPVVKDTVKEEGEEINEYEETKKEVREIESAFAMGIVLKIPKKVGDLDWDFKVGDTVVFNKRFSVEYDLIKDSRLVKPYDIVSIKE